MNRAGSPTGGRKKTSATGASKTPVNFKAAQPAAKTVKTALKKAGSAASGLAQKLAKTVTSITKTSASKNGTPAKAPAPAKASAKAPAKPAKATQAAKAPVKTPAKAPAKTAAKAPAKASVKAPEKSPKASMKNAVKSAANAAASKASAAVKSVKKAAQDMVASARSKAAAKPTGKSAPAKATPKTKTGKPASGSKPAAKSKSAPAKPAASTAKTPRPSRTLRPKSFAELETARGFGFPEETPELPESYGEDRLVLMTKDPEYLFAYWELTPERRAQAERAKRDGEDYREAIRLNWTSKDLLEDSFALVPVSLEAKRWYLRVPFSGLSYYIEIGWLSDQGHFISLLESSNASDAPESWAKTRERLQEHTDALMEYSLSNAHPLGSSESARPASASAKRPASMRNYEGPGAQSSSDAAITIPAAAQAVRKSS